MFPETVEEQEEYTIWSIDQDIGHWDWFAIQNLKSTKKDYQIYVPDHATRWPSTIDQAGYLSTVTRGDKTEEETDQEEEEEAEQLLKDHPQEEYTTATPRQAISEMHTVQVAHTGVAEESASAHGGMTFGSFGPPPGIG